MSGGLHKPGTLVEKGILFLKKAVEFRANPFEGVAPALGILGFAPRGVDLGSSHMASEDPVGCFTEHLVPDTLACAQVMDGLGQLASLFGRIGEEAVGADNELPRVEALGEGEGRLQPAYCVGRLAGTEQDRAKAEQRIGLLAPCIESFGERQRRTVVSVCGSEVAKRAVDVTHHVVEARVVIVAAGFAAERTAVPQAFQGLAAIAILTMCVAHVPEGERFAQPVVKVMQDAASLAVISESLGVIGGLVPYICDIVKHPGHSVVVADAGVGFVALREMVCGE
jgi:hypothetical protein